MWICLNDGFLSVIAHPTDPNLLVVRSRVKGHIQAALGEDIKETCTPDSDYRYRANVSRERVAVTIGTRVRNIEYRNFKDSVKNKKLHDAYLGFWNIMYRLQDDMLPRGKQKLKRLRDWYWDHRQQ